MRQISDVVIPRHRQLSDEENKMIDFLVSQGYVLAALLRSSKENIEETYITLKKRIVSNQKKK